MKHSLLTILVSTIMVSHTSKPMNSFYTEVKQTKNGAITIRIKKALMVRLPNFLNILNRGNYRNKGPLTKKSGGN